MTVWDSIAEAYERLLEALPEVEVDYPEGESHPHIQKARDELGKGLQWIVKGLDKAGTPEMKRIADQLRDLHKRPSDEVVPALSRAMDVLYKAKKSLKKSAPDMPDASPEDRKKAAELSKKMQAQAAEIEDSLVALPSLMKAAHTITKSSRSDQGLWQTKMLPGFPGKEDQPDFGKWTGVAHDRPEPGGFRAKAKMTHPTGYSAQDAADRQASDAASSEKQKMAQVVGPKITKAGDKPAPKPGGPVRPTGNPTMPPAKKWSFTPKPEKKKDEPPKKEGAISLHYDGVADDDEALEKEGVAITKEGTFRTSLSLSRALRERSDQLQGGVADDMEPDDFPPESISKAVEDEREHTNDDDIAAEIGMDHLSQDPEYYEKLASLEGEEPRSSNKDDAPIGQERDADDVANDKLTFDAKIDIGHEDMSPEDEWYHNTGEDEEKEDKESERTDEYVQSTDLGERDIDEVINMMAEMEQSLKK